MTQMVSHMTYIWEILVPSEVLGYIQMGGLHNMSSIEPVCLNEMITEVHSLARTPLCIHQDDAKGCYDHIIRNHANLNNKKFPIPDNVGKIYCEAHEKTKFKTQLHNSISKNLTPAQNRFHFTERVKELKTQEQSGLLSVSPR